MRRLVSLLICCSLASISGCFNRSLPETPAAAPTPRNIILVIGDGMGPQQLGLLELYADLARKRESAFRKLGSSADVSLVLPRGAGTLVVDSGCSATALASGVEGLPETLGVDARGVAVESILESAKRSGKSVGLVSDTRITHATPAAFIAHVTDRNKEREIARQMANSKADILLSGGRKYFESNAKESSSSLELAKETGFRIVSTRGELFRAASDRQPILGLFAPSAMLDAISDSELEVAGRADDGPPSLVEMTETALNHLAKNREGFFLMVEAGQIDWAGHLNDAGWLLAEMLRIEAVVETLSKWQRENPDTLLVITADHETGGFGFSYSSAGVPAPAPFSGLSSEAAWYEPSSNFGSPQVLELLARQRRTIPAMLKDFYDLPRTERTTSKLITLVEETTGYRISLEEAKRLMTDEPNPKFFSHKEKQAEGKAESQTKLIPKIADFSAFYPKARDRRSASLARILSSRTGVTWATGTHTSTPVPMFAVGPGQERLKGLKTQAEVGAVLKSF